MEGISVGFDFYENAESWIQNGRFVFRRKNFPDADPERQSLCVLDKITGGVVRWEKREFGSCGSHERFDVTLQGEVRVGVYIYLNFLALVEVSELGFFEIGGYPDMAGIDDCAKCLFCRNILSLVYGSPGDDAIAGCDDIGMAQFLMGYVEFRFPLFDQGASRGHLVCKRSGVR